LSPYCKTHGACSRRAHQKGTHARIIPSRASSLGGPCPSLYHCHTHVQSFGFGAVVSLACILPSLFLRRRTARETGNIPRRAPFNPVGEHVQSSTRPLPSFSFPNSSSDRIIHRVPTTRVQCRAREACVPAILTCSPPRLRTLPWTALPVASTRAPAFGDRPKNYAMRSNEQRK
jgi:hypothetical protein